MPEDIFNDFMEDYLDVLREMEIIDEVNNNVGEKIIVQHNYHIIIAYASKS